MAMRVPVAGKPWQAAWLIERRTAKGWTQPAAIPELVAALGIKPGSYTNWEAGSRKPPAAVLARIAAFYGVEPPTAPVVVAPKSDIERLIETNLALTQSISLLVNALRPAGQTQEQREEALIAQIAALQAELAVIQQGEAAESPTQPVPLRRTQG